MSISKARFAIIKKKFVGKSSFKATKRQETPLSLKNVEKLRLKTRFGSFSVEKREKRDGDLLGESSESRFISETSGLASRVA